MILLYAAVHTLYNAIDRAFSRRYRQVIHFAAELHTHISGEVHVVATADEEREWGAFSPQGF